MLATALGTRLAVEAKDLVKDSTASARSTGSLAVPTGRIYGILGPNGAGKTTTFRMLLGIIDPTAASAPLLGHERPLDAAREVGYLPEERGLYPAMTAREAIAFMGALRGLPLAKAGARAESCSPRTGSPTGRRGRSAACPRAWRRPSNCSAPSSTSPKLIVLDEPFSGLDAINQEKLEALIRGRRRAGRRSSSRPMSSPMPSGCASGSRSSPAARSRFEGAVDEARDRLRPDRPAGDPRRDGAWRAALPAGRPARGRRWHFELPDGGPEPLLERADRRRRGDRDVSIERPGLHDAFVAIAGAGRARNGQGERRNDSRSISCGRVGHRPPRFHRHRDVAAPSCSSCWGRCSRSGSASCSVGRREGGPRSERTRVAVITARLACGAHGRARPFCRKCPATVPPSSLVPPREPETGAGPCSIDRQPGRIGGARPRPPRAAEAAADANGDAVADKCA